MFEGWSDEDDDDAGECMISRSEETPFEEDYEDMVSASTDVCSAEMRKEEKLRKEKELEMKKKQREFIKERMRLVICNMPNVNLELVRKRNGKKTFIEDGVTKYGGLTKLIKEMFFGEHVNKPITVDGVRHQLIPRRETPPEIALARQAMPAVEGESYHKNCYGRGREHGQRVAHDLEEIICRKTAANITFVKTMQSMENIDNCAQEIIMYLMQHNVVPIASEWKNSCEPIGCATSIDIVAIKDFRFLVHIEVKTCIKPIMVPLTPGVMLKPPFSKIADTPMMRAEIQTLIGSRIMVSMNPRIPAHLRKVFVPDNAYILFINPITTEIVFKESVFFNLKKECCEKVYDMLARDAEIKGRTKSSNAAFYEELGGIETVLCGRKRSGSKRGSRSKRR